MTILIDVPPGLNGVAVTDTAIGDVDGEAGYYHYRGHDATALARACSFEEVWHLVAVGHLPDAAEAARFRDAVVAARRLPQSVLPVLEPLAQARGYIDQDGHGFILGAWTDAINVDPINID